MGNLLQGSPIETVVAYFFAFTALATLFMSSWAYVYQKRRESKAASEPLPPNHGEFFIRR